MSEKVKNLLIVNIMFFIYSFSGVFTKLAAREKMFSFNFFAFYGGTLLIMAVYAFVWQQIIHKLPLMVAYANKAMVVIWGLVWGCLFFQERLTAGKVISVLLVAVGVALFARTYEEQDE